MPFFIHQLTESYQNSRLEPKLETSDHAFRITLPNRNFKTDQASPFAQANNNHLLAALSGKETFTRQDVQDTMGVSRSQANNLIKELVDSGRLVAMGAGKNRHYAQSKN